MTIPEGNAALAALGYRAATDERIADIAQMVLDRAAHDHPVRGEDLYCLSLTSWMGERMGPVLVRLRDAEAERNTALAEVERLRAERNDAVATVAELAQRLTARERVHNADRAVMERLRAEVKRRDQDADRWRHVEPILTRAQEKGCPYLDVDDLVDAVQDAETGADDGTCDRHNASTQEATP